MDSCCCCYCCRTINSPEVILTGTSNIYIYILKNNKMLFVTYECSIECLVHANNNYL